MDRKRLIWADAAKGFLILLVVIGHTLQHGDYEHNIFWNIIYSFHMAAFFTISGYVSYKKELSWGIIGRRARQLLIPFVIWSSIQSICLMNYGIDFLDFLFYPDRGFWFIHCLFFIVLLFVALCLISNNLNIDEIYLVGLGICFLLLLMLIFNFRVFGFQFISFYFFFYALGYYIRKYEIKINLSISIVIGFIWFVLALFWHGHEVPQPLVGLSMIPSSLLIYVYRFITATLGSLFVIGIFPFLFNNKNLCITKVFCFLGELSLGIYILHLLAANLINHYSLLRPLFVSETSFPFLLSFFVVTLIIGVLGTYWFSKISITNYLLLGKSYHGKYSC